MHLTPAPERSRWKRTAAAWPERVRLAPPTVSGMVTAGAGVLLLSVTSLLLLVPSVFYLVPVPAEADAITLCLPGIGPLQRFREGLEGEWEEMAYIHEGVHADQCRMFGAAWYARQATTPGGRLTLEAQALCAEVAVLSLRGGDPKRLRGWVVETLESDYFDDPQLPRAEIVAAVDGACGAS